MVSHSPGNVDVVPVFIKKKNRLVLFTDIAALLVLLRRVETNLESINLIND